MENAENENTKKYFRNPDDRLLGGVCSGLAAFFGWETLPLRIIFFVLIFFTGLWIIPAYLIVWLLAPEAHTAEEKLRMRGCPLTADKLSQTVQDAFREQQMKNSVVSNFVIFVGVLFKICFILLATLLVFPLVIIIAALIAVLLSILLGLGLLPIEWLGLSDFLIIAHPLLAVVALVVVLLIPLTVIVYSIVSLLARWKPVHWAVKLFILTVWLLAIAGVVFSGIRINRNFDVFNTARRLPLIEDFSPVAGMNTWHGNGRYAEKTFRQVLSEHITLDPHTAVHLDIEQVADGVLPSDSMEITVCGDDNLIDKIECRADGRITSNHSRLKSDNELTVKIRTSRLQAVSIGGAARVTIPGALVSENLIFEMHGAGSITAPSLTVHSLTVDAEGAGSLELKGKAIYASLKLEGIGEIDAEGLTADTVIARMEGIGSIKCNPIDYLDSRINGVGSISYPVEPRNSRKTKAGIGRIATKRE
jgi:phage shock protein PspC (stress-responsive transcriptional regulator)